MSISDSLLPRRLSLETVGLSVTAGYIDGYALRQAHTYVSFISGNTTTAATRIGSGASTLAVPALLAVLGFFCGSFAGSWIASSSLPRPRRAILLLSAMTLLAQIVLLARQTPSMTANILLLSFAMAVLNPSIKRIGSEPVNVTFVTGTLNKAAGHLVMALRGQRPDHPTGAKDTHGSRAMLEVSLWVALFLGAIGSIQGEKLGKLACGPACVTLLILAAIIE